MTFLACALHKLFVRSCDLAHHGLCCSHVCACAHHSSLQHLPFCVRFRCPSVPVWMNFRTCGCLLAPQGGITLAARAFRSQHYTLSNNYKLMRAPRPLCRYRPPHGSHMVQRLQALCPADRLHTVPSVHRFRRAPPALLQVTLCQPRSLRLPRSSPLPHSWSVAYLYVLPHRPATRPHSTSGCRHADYSTHRSLSGRFYATLARGALSDVFTHIIPRGPSTFYARCSLPHVFPTHPSCFPGRSCADSFTQCRFCRCHHTTAAH